MPLTWTPPKNEKEDDKFSSVDLAMFDTEDEKSSFVDIKMFDIDDSNASDLDDCCHHIEKVSTSIQMFSFCRT
jgi:exoribonuclease II